MPTIMERGKWKAEAILELCIQHEAKIERLTNELAQMKSQCGDPIELQEAEQRGYLRGQNEIERLTAALAAETERCAIAARDALNHDGYEETAEFVASAIRSSAGLTQQKTKSEE